VAENNRAHYQESTNKSGCEKNEYAFAKEGQHIFHIAYFPEIDLLSSSSRVSIACYNPK
jgi:uncharacterized protein YkuJ